MDFESWVIAADEDEIADVGDSPRPLSAWSGIDSSPFDVECLAALHVLATGEPWQMAMERYEPVHVSPDDDTVVLRFSDDLVEVLAGLDEDSSVSFAVELASSEVFEDIDWPEERVSDFLLTLTELAQLAESQGQTLLLVIRAIRSPDEDL